MHPFKSLTIAVMTSIISTTSFAVPIFRITPTVNSFSVTNGTTTEVQYDVRNVSGRPITITTEKVEGSNTAVASSAISSNSTCENGSLANNADCTLGIDVTGNGTGSETVRPIICAFNGQLCSRAPVATTVNVVAQGTFPCATNTDDDNKQCRVFVTNGTYKGDLSQSTGNANISSCQNNASGVTKGNCICEAEAAQLGYGHPGHWRVWLSTATTGAITNIKYTSGGSVRYVKAADIESTVANQETLVGTNLTNSIGENQVCAWTATSAQNGLISGINGTCNDWTSKAVNAEQQVASGNVSATFVNQDGAIFGWSENPVDGVCGPTFNCNTENRLYCFETPN